MEKALQFYYTHPELSISAVARKFSVSCCTLSDRLCGAHSNHEAHMDKQRLTPEQEEKLVEWIIDWRRNGVGITHQMVGLMVTTIICVNGNNQPVGQHWISHFIQRHERLKTTVSCPIKIEQFLACKDETIPRYYE
jgi:hypothetical protein